MSADKSSLTNEQFRILFDLSPDPVWIIEKQHFVDCNHAAVRMLGYRDKAELLDVHPSELSPECQPDGEASFSKANKMMQQAVACGIHRFEWAHKRADGSLFDAEVTLTRIELSSGTAIYCAWRDISERKRSERKLQELTIELQKAVAVAESASEAKSRFLATVSHEIRTPLNGVLGMAQIMLEPRLSQEDRLAYARTILSSGRVLLTLLNDILDFSKIEAGKFDLLARPFSPVQVLEDIRHLFVETARLGGLELHCQWHGRGSARYLADDHRLQQMLSNLVGNALKFTQRGYVRVQARELESGVQDAWLEFEVIDSGVGVPQDKSDLLFQPFSQVDSSTTRRHGGTGLGLSIVRRLAEMMDGSAGFESQPGQGARFWFRVRVGQSEPLLQPVLEAAQGAQDLAEAGQRVSGRVLLVEDNPTNRMVLSLLLEKLGYACTQACDGQRAVEAVQMGEEFDAILMDVQMPVMDGYAATALIRDWEAACGRPPMPIIAVTADAFEDDRSRCLSSGMSDHLTKPVSLAALREALALHLSLRF